MSSFFKYSLMMFSISSFFNSILFSFKDFILDNNSPANMLIKLSLSLRIHKLDFIISSIVALLFVVKGFNAENTVWSRRSIEI